MPKTTVAAISGQCQLGKAAKQIGKHGYFGGEKNPTIDTAIHR